MNEAKEAAPEAVEAPKQESGELTQMQAEARLAAAGLDKFKDVDALAKSYSELEKKFHDSRLPKNANEEVLKAKTKEFYSGYESKSALDGTLGEWSQELAERTGLPAQMVDLVAATVSQRSIEREAKANKAQVAALLQDKATLAKINMALEEKGADYEVNLSERIQAGHVTAGELRMLADLGASKAEPGAPIEAEAGVNADASSENELMGILNNRQHPYYNPSHADHYKAVDRVDKLKKVLGF